MGDALIDPRQGATTRRSGLGESAAPNGRHTHHGKGVADTPGQGALDDLGFPTGWHSRNRFVVLDTDFDSGRLFLATWKAWQQADPGKRGRLSYLALAPQGFDSRALASRIEPTCEPGAQALLAAWPPATPDMHRLVFEDGHVELLLSFGELRPWLRGLVARVDAFNLGAIAPDTFGGISPPRLFKALARLAAPGATLTLGRPDTRAHLAPESPDATPSPKPDGMNALDGLAAAGFKQLATASGSSCVAIYAPSFEPRKPAGRTASATSATVATAVTDAGSNSSTTSPLPAADARHVVIIGGGLAGCAAACELAAQGWSSTIYDRQPAPAMETSGNAGGIFHGVTHGHDGTHARFNRAAALEAARAVRYAIDRHGAEGQVDGLLRLETSLRGVDAMNALLVLLGLPPDYVQAVDPERAARLTGLPLSLPGWWYPAAGWVSPPDLSRSFLARAGAKARFIGDSAIASVALEPPGAYAEPGKRWRVTDEHGNVIAHADVVVLANANDAARLVTTAGCDLGVRLNSVRGQVSTLEAEASGMRAPRVPIAGAGYALPASRGHVSSGSTTAEGDLEPSLRPLDHMINVEQFMKLTGSSLDPANITVAGRVGWRCVAPDRLPLVGGVAKSCAGARIDQPRMVPREPGLFVFTALGSRGIAWSPLGARVLASWITGAPFPVDSRLIDAIDPARFISRAARVASS